MAAPIRYLAAGQRGITYTAGMTQGVLFDIDGTLVLSNDAHSHAWEEAFAESGYEIPFNKIRPLMGMGGDKLISQVQPSLNAEEGDGKIIKERRKEIFLEKYAPTLRPAPGARELVEAIQAVGLKTMIASSATNEELEVLLQAADLQDLLNESTTSDDAENSKPDPDIIHVALQKIALAADEVVMIGDAPFDLQAAGKAGVRVIALRCGGWPDDELTGAVAIYDDPADLLAHRSDFGY